MKTLEEMIDKYENYSEECLYIASKRSFLSINIREDGLEYGQIADWLKELQAYKEDRVGCEFCKHQDKLEKERPCSLCKHNFMDMFESGVEENG